MVRLLLPPALLISLSACIFYRESDRHHDESAVSESQPGPDPCWRGDRWVCGEDGARPPGDACWNGNGWVACEDDPEDDTFTAAELGVLLTPGEAPPGVTFIASLFTLGDFPASDIAEIGFVSRDRQAILPQVVAQRVRSASELVVSIDIPAAATSGVIDAYLTFTDDDYVVVERIFEVLEPGGEIGPWEPPSHLPEEPVDTGME